MGTSERQTVLSWLTIGTLYGLIYGGTVALLITLRTVDEQPENTLQQILLVRSRIGGLSGAFFGAVAGLIGLLAYLRTTLDRAVGRRIVELLLTLLGALGIAAVLYATVAAPFIAGIHWSQVVTRHTWLLTTASLIAPLLALPPLLYATHLISHPVVLPVHRTISTGEQA